MGAAVRFIPDFSAQAHDTIFLISFLIFIVIVSLIFFISRDKKKLRRRNLVVLKRVPCPVCRGRKQVALDKEKPERMTMCGYCGGRGETLMI